MHARPRVLVAAILLFVLLSLVNLASLALPSGDDGIPIECCTSGLSSASSGYWQRGGYGRAAAGHWSSRCWCCSPAFLARLQGFSSPHRPNSSSPRALASWPRC